MTADDARGAEGMSIMNVIDESKTLEVRGELCVFPSVSDCVTPRQETDSCFSPNKYHDYYREMEAVLPFPCTSPQGLYRFVRQIGQGHSGTVWECVQLLTGETVACKRIRKEGLRSLEREELMREIAIMDALKGNRNIVRLREVCEDSRAVYLFMDFCDGGELFHKIVRDQGIKPREAAPLFRQLVSAVQFCHANGVLHRDLKPENILLCSATSTSTSTSSIRSTSHVDKRQTTAAAALCTSSSSSTASSSSSSSTSSSSCPSTPSSSSSSSDGIPPKGSRRKWHHHSAEKWELKLADFGFALVLRAGEITRDVAGSRLYEAPELIRFQEFDHKADVWSLGVILYAMLSGCLPFRGATDVELGCNIVKGRVNMGGRQWQSVPADAKRLVRRMLEVDAKKRCSTEDVLNDPWLLRHCGVAKPAPYCLPPVALGIGLTGGAAVGARGVGASLSRRSFPHGGGQKGAVVAHGGINGELKGGRGRVGGAAGVVKGQSGGVSEQVRGEGEKKVDKRKGADEKQMRQQSSTPAASEPSSSVTSSIDEDWPAVISISRDSSLTSSPTTVSPSHVDSDSLPHSLLCTPAQTPLPLQRCQLQGQGLVTDSPFVAAMLQQQVSLNGEGSHLISPVVKMNGLGYHDEDRDMGRNWNERKSGEWGVVQKEENRKASCERSNGRMTDGLLARGKENAVHPEGTKVRESCRRQGRKGSSQFLSFMSCWNGQAS